MLQARNHKGALNRHSSLHGKYYCHSCVSDMSAKTLDKIYTKRNRIERVIARCSRGKVLSPNDIYEIAYRVMSKIRCRMALQLDWSAGYIDGRPIAIVEDINFDNAVQFWMDVKSKPKKRISEKSKTQLFFAVLMLILGDKNAGRYC
jgi:hypothetical protein